MQVSFDLFLNFINAGFEAITLFKIIFVLSVLAALLFLWAPGIAQSWKDTRDYIFTSIILVVFLSGWQILGFVFAGFSALILLLLALLLYKRKEFAVWGYKGELASSRSGR